MIHVSPRWCAGPLRLFARRRQMLYKRQLGPGMQLSKVYLIHKRTDKEDAPPCAAQQVFLREGIGHRFRNETVTLVRNGNYQRLASLLKTDCDLPRWVVLVAVQDGVYRSLPHRHGHVKSFVFA